jgi:hypothetical protein
MNNGNPIEEMHADESSHDLNLRRRRLIRGAAYVAPMVLTLRSGALAAASSCTGAKLLTTTKNSSGQLNSSTGIEAGDICAINYSQDGCPTGENKISIGVKAGSVTQSGSNFKCAEVTGANTQVAIISSASATSLNLI